MWRTSLRRSSRRQAPSSRRARPPRPFRRRARNRVRRAARRGFAGDPRPPDDVRGNACGGRLGSGGHQRVRQRSGVRRRNSCRSRDDATGHGRLERRVGAGGRGSRRRPPLSGRPSSSGAGDGDRRVLRQGRYGHLIGRIQPRGDARRGGGRALGTDRPGPPVRRCREHPPRREPAALDRRSRSAGRRHRERHARRCPRLGAGRGAGPPRPGEPGVPRGHIRGRSPYAPPCNGSCTPVRRGRHAVTHRRARAGGSRAG